MNATESMIKPKLYVNLIRANQFCDKLKTMPFKG
jgi:hypothetical protein